MRPDKRIPLALRVVEQRAKEGNKPRIYVNYYGYLHARYNPRRRWVCDDGIHSYSATTPLFAYRGWARQHKAYSFFAAAHKIHNQISI